MKIAILLIGVLGFAALGLGARAFLVTNSSVNEGTWVGFPAPGAGLDPVAGDACSVGTMNAAGVAAFGGQYGDECELMGSGVHRTVLVLGNTEGGISVGLSVGCVKPAIPTSQGSVLYLQWANYTVSSTLWENASNFVIANPQQAIYVDNTLGWDCPGTLTAGYTFPLPALTASCCGGSTVAFEFRVVGVCGCNSTTVNAGNVQLSFVNLIVSCSCRQSPSVEMFLAPGLTTFKYQANMRYPVSASTPVRTEWVATNGVSTQEGLTNSTVCVIPIGGITCNSVAIAYPVAFTVTAPNVVLTPYSPIGGVFVLPLGSLSFMSGEVKRL